MSTGKVGEGKKSQPVTSAFHRFATSLSITKEDQDTAVKLHLPLRTALIAYSEVVETFISGSYDRGTACGKLNDVDVMVVIDSSKIPDPQKRQQWLLEVTKDLANTVKLEPGVKVQDVRKQKASIGVLLSGSSGQPLPSVDLVPVIRDGDEYIIWKHDKLIRTNPKRVRERLVSERQKPHNNHLSHTILLVKAFNNRLKMRGFQQAWTRRVGHKPLPSIVVETMLYDAFQSSQATSLPKAVEIGFGEIYKKLMAGAPIRIDGSDDFLLTAPDDVPSEMKSKWSELVVKPFDAAYRMARMADDAQNRGDHETALKLWRQVYPGLDKL